MSQVKKVKTKKPAINQEKKEKLEEQMLDVLSRKKRIGGVIVKLGSQKYLFRGEFKDMGELLDNVILNKLIRIEDDGNTWSSWDDKYKPLDNQFDVRLPFLEIVQEGNMLFDEISFSRIELYEEKDVIKMKGLQKAYAALIPDDD